MRSFVSLHFSHFCRPPTDSASHWRTKMVGAAVWARGGAGAVVARRARAPGQAVSTWRWCRWLSGVGRYGYREAHRRGVLATGRAATYIRARITALGFWLQRGVQFCAAQAVAHSYCGDLPFQPTHLHVSRLRREVDQHS